MADRKSLIASEREKFLTQEWPAMLNRIDQLGLSVEELLQNAETEESDS